MASKGKMAKVMREMAAGKLHSGSKRGPVVRKLSQARAIGLSEARAAGEHVSPKPKQSYARMAGRPPKSGSCRSHRYVKVDDFARAT